MVCAHAFRLDSLRPGYRCWLKAAASTDSMTLSLSAVRYRNYHPALGRWIERDPEGYVDGMSLYQYCLSNPANMTDPTGLEGESVELPGWKDMTLTIDPNKQGVDSPAAPVAPSEWQTPTVSLGPGGTGNSSSGAVQYDQELAPGNSYPPEAKEPKSVFWAGTGGFVLGALQGVLNSTLRFGHEFIATVVNVWDESSGLKDLRRDPFDYWQEPPPLMDPSTNNLRGLFLQTPDWIDTFSKDVGGPCFMSLATMGLARGMTSLSISKAEAAQAFAPKFGGQTLASESGGLSGPVTFGIPQSGATPAEIAQIRAYVAGANDALEAGALSPTGRVSTTGSLRIAANDAANVERARAAAAGNPYIGQVGHVPDTTWTGTAQPYSWLDLSPSINSSLGSQAAKYPIGYQPTQFFFEVPK